MKKLTEAQARIAQTARAYDAVFSSPDGEAVLKDLIHRFDGTTLKKTKDGLIDPHASIAAAGCREVLLYIELMRKRHATATGDS